MSKTKIFIIIAVVVIVAVLAYIFLVPFILPFIVPLLTTPTPTSTPATHTGLDINSTIGELLDNADTSAVIDECFPGFSTNPQVATSRPWTFEQIRPFAEGTVTDAIMTCITDGLLAIPTPTSTPTPTPAPESEPAPEPAPEPEPPATHTGLDINSTIGELLDNADTLAVIDECFPGFSTDPQVATSRPWTFEQIRPFAGGTVTDAIMTCITDGLLAIK